MDLRKRITAFIVVLSIFSLQVTPILATSNQSDLLVLKAREISVKAKDGDVNGTTTKCTVIENPVQGVKSLLNEETEIISELNNQNTDTIFSNEESMYVQNGLNINVKEVQTRDAIVVAEDIDIHSKQFSSSDFTILYCENGNIELNVKDMTFDGLIYAPNGTVSINAKNVDITGAIIADTIDINANMFNITADEYSDNMQQYLDVFIKDGNYSEPSSKIRCISSLWRIRHITSLKYAHECKHSSHILVKLRGSEQLQMTDTLS